MIKLYYGNLNWLAVFILFDMNYLTFPFLALDIMIGRLVMIP